MAFFLPWMLCLIFASSVGIGGFKYLRKQSILLNDTTKKYLFSDSLMVVFISGDCIEIGLLFGPNADVEVECVRNTSDPKKIIEMCLPIEALINDALQVSGMKFVLLIAGNDIPIHVEKALLVRDNRNNIVGYFDSEDIESSGA